MRRSCRFDCKIGSQAEKDKQRDAFGTILYNTEAHQFGLSSDWRYHGSKFCLDALVRLDGCGQPVRGWVKGGHRNKVMASETDTRTGATALTAKDFEKVVLSCIYVAASTEAL